MIHKIFAGILIAFRQLKSFFAWTEPRNEFVFVYTERKYEQQFLLPVVCLQVFHRKLRIQSNLDYNLAEHPLGCCVCNSALSMDFCAFKVPRLEVVTRLRILSCDVVDVLLWTFFLFLLLVFHPRLLNFDPLFPTAFPLFVSVSWHGVLRYFSLIFNS